MRKLVIAAVAVIATIVAVPGTTWSSSSKDTTIPLPAGVVPEGIVTGRHDTFYAGSLAGGQIVRGDLRKGTVESFVTSPATTITVGLSYDRRRDLLFAAGGATGGAGVYDARTGATVASLTLTTATPRFVNDVIVTRRAAYFTNSNQPELYRVPIGAKGEIGAPEVLPLSGPAGQFVPGFNLNGIEATDDGRTLIVVNSTTGQLFTVDPRSGASAVIDLGGASVTAGDGLWLDGRTLYVVRNRLNEVAVFRLSRDLASAKLVDTITSPLFEVPTTIARSGDKLVLVNAQFGLPQPNPYEVVVLKRDDDRD